MIGNAANIDIMGKGVNKLLVKVSQAINSHWVFEMVYISLNIFISFRKRTIHI